MLRKAGGLSHTGLDRDCAPKHSTHPEVFAEFSDRRCTSGQTNAPRLARFVLGLVLLMFATQASAQSTAISIPENAHAKRYGDGWECDTSFRPDGDQCVAVVVPKNAYGINHAYGKGWECHHGFKETNETSCVKVVVPAGAYLDSLGERWRCLRGFEKNGETCRKIAIPPNAFLDSSAYETAWRCDRGYMASEGKCVAIDVPKNGYLNPRNYGQPWICERGFYENDGKCDPVIVPPNAYFDSSASNSRWECERGYSKVRDGCELIILPENAHLDNAGNRWTCNRNFRLKERRCVPRR